MLVCMAVAGGLQELLRIFFELRQTVLAAKIIGFPVVNVFPGSVAWLHFHTANRINHGLFL